MRAKSSKQRCPALGTEPVTFFGHNPRLGGTVLIWGGTAPECPPWRRA